MRLGMLIVAGLACKLISRFTTRTVDAVNTLAKRVILPVRLMPQRPKKR